MKHAYTATRYTFNRKNDEQRPTDTDWDDYKTAHYLNTNTIDPDMDIDGSVEFCDIDDEYYGLSIVEPEGVLATARFLNGYDT
jgi:hypothetical protein